MKKHEKPRKQKADVMFDIEMDLIGEIRMGSPYNICHLHFSGDWVPDLPETDWQDIIAWNGDHSKVALVRWDTPGNVPGFRIIVIDPKGKKVTKTRRIQGCCRSVTWTDDSRRINWTASFDNEGSFTVK